MKLQYEIKSEDPTLSHFKFFHITMTERQFPTTIQTEESDEKLIYGYAMQYTKKESKVYPLMGDQDNPYFYYGDQKIHLLDFCIPGDVYENGKPKENVDRLLEKFVKGIKTPNFSDEDILRMILLKYRRYLYFKFVSGSPIKGSFYCSVTHNREIVNSRNHLFISYNGHNLSLYTDDLSDLIKKGIMLIYTS